MQSAKIKFNVMSNRAMLRVSYYIYATKQKCLYVLCLLTRRGDAAHLNGTGHMASCPTVWVHEVPLLSSNQVACHTL